MGTKWKKLKIREQILWSMSLISICSALVLGTIVYSVSSRIIATKYKNTYDENLEISSKITDIQLNILISLMRNQLLNKDLMSALKMSGENLEVSRFFSVEENLKLANLLSSVAGQNSQIEGITLISNSGEVIFYYKTEKQGTIYEKYQNINILEKEWISSIANANGKEVFFSNDIILNRSGQFFTIGKQLNDPFADQTVGYMLVSVRNQLFHKAFGLKNDANSSRYNFVIDENCETPLVFFSGSEEKEDEIVSNYLYSPSDINTYVFSSATNQLTGWKMVNAVYRHELNKYSREIASVVIVSLIILLVVSYFISDLISKRIERPLKKLEAVIKKVGDGERSLKETFDDSEIGMVGNQFVNLVSDNLQLNEQLLSLELKERESELLLLQSQINPHFLYNTLDSLYCMAIINNNDDIAEIVASLSNIFRLSLSKGNKIVGLEDEIRHIKEYMFIQNIRYNNRFELTIDIPDEIMKLTILKLTLQPLVENAVYHGLEPKLGKGSINISGWRNEDDVYFVIEDDGVGMNNLSVTQNGYGVRNVDERIQLYYGDKYGLVFESEAGVGTNVTVHISAGNKAKGVQE